MKPFQEIHISLKFIQIHFYISKLKTFFGFLQNVIVRSSSYRVINTSPRVKWFVTGIKFHD